MDADKIEKFSLLRHGEGAVDVSDHPSSPPRHGASRWLAAVLILVVLGGMTGHFITIDNSTHAEVLSAVEKCESPSRVPIVAPRKSEWQCTRQHRFELSSFRHMEEPADRGRDCYPGLAL